MVRWLLLSGLLFGPLCFGAEALYLSNAEKALVGFALKSVQDVELEKSDSKLDSIQKLIVERLRIYHETEPLVIPVASFDDFLKVQSEGSLFQETRLDELDRDFLYDMMKPVRYQSESLRVQKKIEAYEARRVHFLQTFMTGLGLQALKIGRKQNIDIEALQAEIESAFTSRVNELTSNLNLQNSLEVKVLSKLVKSYFKNLPAYQKLEILYRISHMPFESKSLDVFLTMIQNSGPQMQKLVQIMGRSEHVPETFQEIFQKLESQVRPVPWWKVRKVLEKENVNLNQFTYFERKPIGVGTMAQTHRAQYRDEFGVRQSVVVRFLKPEIEKYLEMDHQILKKIAVEIDGDPELLPYKLPSLARLVEDLHQSVVEELSVQATVRQQKRGQQIYPRSEVIAFNGQKNVLGFHVPEAKMYLDKGGVMIQELVVGQKPTKELQMYKDIYPDLYRIISEKTAEMWVEEAFFRSGFFHADLHQGNMMASFSDKEISVYLLDFGMTGQLNAQLRESALLLALGIKLERADLIAESYLKLGRMNNPHLKGPELSRQVQSRIDRLKIEPGLGGSLEAWTAWALDLGLELEYEFLKLNRGLTAIEGLLSDSKSSISVHKLAQKIAFRNKAYVSKLLLKESKIKMKDYGKLALSLFEEDPLQKPKTAGGLQCHALF